MAYLLSKRGRRLAPPIVMTVAIGAAGCSSEVTGGTGGSGGSSGGGSGSGAAAGAGGTGTATSTFSNTDTGSVTDTYTYTDTDTGSDTGNPASCPIDTPVKGSPCSPNVGICYYDMACGHYPTLQAAEAYCLNGEWYMEPYTAPNTSTATSNPPAPCPCGPPNQNDVCGVPSLAGDQVSPCTYDECEVWECDGYGDPWETATATGPGC